MIDVWFGMHFGKNGEVRTCLITRILDGPEKATDTETGEPVFEYFKTPEEDEDDE